MYLPIHKSCQAVFRWHPCTYSRVVNREFSIKLNELVDGLRVHLYFWQNVSVMNESCQAVFSWHPAPTHEF